MRKIALILSAGKQTRFGNTLPKSLVALPDGEQLLHKNISVLENYVDDIYVAVGKDDIDKYVGYEKHLIPVEKGGGCGHAVYQACEWLKNKYTEPFEILLEWGDSLHTTERRLFDELFSLLSTIDLKDNTIVVPVVVEKDPYMVISMNNDGRWTAKYSKYGEIEYPVTGYHDTAVFYTNSSIISSMEEYVDAYYNSEKHEYSNKPSKEFEFLYLLDKYCDFIPCDMGCDFLIKSFNTVEELNTLKKNN